MSLVGSLEDLGLGDILQIISLSRKTGLLVLRTDDGEGQIQFRDGGIRCAFSKGGPTDLRELVAACGDVAPAALEQAVASLRGPASGLEALLIERELLGAERIDELRREHIDRTVIDMFTWPTGEFSFEANDVELAPEAGLAVEPGVNPQFLALEGTRLRDESLHADGAGGEPMFSGEDEDSDAAEGFGAQPDVDAMFSGEGGLADAEPPAAADRPAPEVATTGRSSEATAPSAEASGPSAEATAPSAEATAPSAEASGPSAEASAPSAPPPAVIAVDGDLRCLEWIRTALAEHHPRIHIFQRPELGVSRIRQYLARAEVPLVLLAADAPADPLSGARDAKDLVGRLKAQTARMPIALLVTEAERGTPPGAADAVVVKPTPEILADSRRSEQREALAIALAEDLERFAVEPAAAASSEPEPAAAASSEPEPAAAASSEPEPAAAASSEPEPAEPASLDEAGREALARLRASPDREAAFQTVLERAAADFGRVALFAIEGTALVGLAQHGLPRAGGPDAADFAEVRLPSLDCAAAQAALEAPSGAHRGPLDDEGGHRLAVLLGNTIPEEAWIAGLRPRPGAPPCALLYADNLPGGELIGETQALELFLAAAASLLAPHLAS